MLHTSGFGFRARCFDRNPEMQLANLTELAVVLAVHFCPNWCPDRVPPAEVNITGRETQYAATQVR